MQKILVIGGAGYIGSVLTGHLLRRGYRVTVLDSLTFGQTTLLGYCADENFSFVRGDSRDERIVAELLPQHDAVLPLAAIVGMPVCNRDPFTARSTNLDAILQLLRLRDPAQPLIYPCTNSGYGTKTGDVFCTEETPMEPVSLYGETKVQAEQAVLNSPNTISLRLATVFGPSPRMRLDLLVNDFVHRAVTDGVLVLYEPHFKRNYVHINDVAEAFCFALEHFDDMRGEPYNVGLNEANLSKLELAEKIKAYVPKLYIHCAEVGSDPDKRNYIVSNDKINRKGFVARHTLDEGIRQLLQVCRMLPAGPFRNA